ncbi:D-alanine--D-alanine ligase [Ancylobacter dichloromethanicus]|uniref:D-alanine--D-alanine ligase n=1 Tax=Ancylobacter dichloromethanicus TaxID=518825 RepID=A0A9W6MXU9_9HYPH|nr:D-alanine--D-alanine ligase [Ancylobacter dichloromethanicus]MBS7555226.1 D-alanine--D-alanine ligase [Ancylobacter dichloromethanicus]GLK70406.1 D-alanine--D-alanine ligase [Ancylobacter dichloromethanicus]
MGKHVAVLMGGWSPEREVSLWSGEACARAAESVGYRVTRVDVGRDIAQVLGALKPDVALNVLHGRPGEDGTIQGILEVLRIPYTHSGVLASALAMDKAQAKIILAAHGIAVPEGRLVTREEAARAHVLPRPYVLKPNTGGSSVGVFIVREDQEHPPQELNRVDWGFGEALIAERYIPGLELTCAVMGDKALGVIEIQSDLKFYDYEAKYAPGGSRHILPAQILPIIYQKAQMLAVEAHRALGCRGISRSDFRYDDRTGDESGLVCLEVNTQPGMTETSLVPELAAHAGHSFGELVRWMVEDASLDR